MDISDLAARPEAREEGPAESQERRTRRKARREGPGRKPGKKGAAAAAERGSAEQDVEDHHQGEAGCEADGADVGVGAFGGFGHEFFDYHIEHCSGGE